MTWLGYAAASPSGDNVSKDIYSSNKLFNSAKSAVDSFEDDFDSFRDNIALTLQAIGVAILTWETFVGVIASGIAGAAAAAAALDDWNDAQEDIGDAYDYISAA